PPLSPSLCLHASFARMAQETPAPRRSNPRGQMSHPGLSLLSEVTAALSAGVFTESAMEEVARLLRRGLGASLCRLWVRLEDTRTYEPFSDVADVPTPEVVAQMGDAIRSGTAEQTADSWDSLDLRVAINHEGERLGLIEICVPRDGRESMARDVLDVIANV